MSRGRKLGALHRCIIPMCSSFHQCMPFSDNLPVCVEGALPLSSTFCPYRARYLLKPESWGDPGCRSLCSLYPGLRYPCPYRAPRLQNHWFRTYYMCLDRERCGFKTIDLEHILYVSIGNNAASKPPNHNWNVCSKLFVISRCSKLFLHLSCVIVP